MLAIVNNVLQHSTKTGKPYVVFDLFTDERKKINAKLWDTDKKSLTVKNHQIIKVELTEDEYRGQPSYVINEYSVMDDKDVDRSIFLPTLAEEKRNLHQKMLGDFVGKVSVPKYVDLLNAFLTDHKDKYIVWPASKVMHGAYLGGLLEHSIRVCNFSVALAEQFRMFDGNDNFNLDLIITGSLLHDIGKMFTYEFGEGIIDYNEHEKLIGHPLFACMIIGNYQTKLGHKYLELIHLISSHMRKPEWGAIVTPKTFEADVVAYADEVEARASEFLRDDMDWSDKKVYSQARGDFIFRTKHAVQTGGKSPFKRK